MAEGLSYTACCCPRRAVRGLGSNPFLSRLQPPPYGGGFVVYGVLLPTPRCARLRVKSLFVPTSASAIWRRLCRIRRAFFNLRVAFGSRQSASGWVSAR